MLCALEAIDSSSQSTSHNLCNRSFCQTIGHCFPKGQLIKEPVSVRLENRVSALTIPQLGNYSDWIPTPFLSGIREVRVSSLASEAPGTEDTELLSAQQGIFYWSSQLNERNMHDQVDSSKPGSSGFPHGGNRLGKYRHRKNMCDEPTGAPLRHMVTKKSSRPGTATLGSDSNVLHLEDNSLKSPKKKGSKKRKLYGHAIHKKLNPASENTLEENAYATFSARVVKEAHLGKDGAESGYVECGTMLDLSALGTGEMDGSECSTNDAVAESCRCVTYLNNGANSIHALEFNGSTSAKHGLREERNIRKLFRPCPCNLDSTDTFFSTWNSHNSESVNIEARPSTGLNDVRMEYCSISSHPDATHAADINDHSISNSCCSKDVTDSTSHIERVKRSSEASSSKTCLPFNSDKSNRKSRKTPSCSDLTISNRVLFANRHKSGGKDSTAVWQKVEKVDSHVSRGHTEASHLQDKTAQEDANKGIQQDETRHRAKRKQNKKACKQEAPNFEMESTKGGDDAFNSFQTSSKSIYKKQVPFLHQQRSSFFKQGSQSLKNYYAPKNGIPRVPKAYSRQEELPPLQLVHVKDTTDRAALSFCSADEVIQTGVGSNCKAEGKESLQSDIEKTTLSSCNLFSDLVPKAASLSSGNLYADPCASEREEERCAILTIENNPQESCKLYSSSGHLSQKWVPVGKKKVPKMIHLDVSEASVVEGSVAANDVSDSDSVGHASTSGEDIKLASKLTSKLNPYDHIDLKWSTDKGTEASYNKIIEAISDVYIARQRVEDIQLRIGRPLADFERFMYSASPVLHCSPCPSGCKPYLQECVKDGLCLHQSSNITLSSVWQWYEEPGCYGLEVKAQDFRRSKGLWNSECQFTTYFVPYLSAVQLFRQHKRISGGSTDREAVDMDMTCETSPCLNPPPIFAKLMPQQSPRNRSSTLDTEGHQWSSIAELIFEYFESEQPYWRRQLFDKVNELIAGVKPVNCHMSGDPKNLELSLCDLHPSSWYCVAWYPIYCIPDGKFQAAFLTYHSLGHWIHRNSSAYHTGQAPIVFPVIGLQSYNDKAEWWFQMGKYDSEDTELVESQAGEASQVLKERLRTLTEAAGMMSRSDVLKNDQLSRNRHPDYEFFVSRC